MAIKKILTGVLLSAFILVATGLAQEVEEKPLTGLKKRVAVFSFQDKTDYGQGNVGEGMADMLTTELVKSGKYRVIERSQIEAVMQEQKLGLTGAVTSNTASQLGKLLGVELAVFGSVTEFGQKEESKGIGFGKRKFGANQIKARVAIDVRIVNVEIGEILAADNVAKEESQTGISVKIPDFNFQNQAEFDKTLVGKATRACVQEIVGKIDAQMGRVPWYGKIIKESGGIVYINRGVASGLQVGNVLEAYSPGEELIDPETGISLGSEESKIGRVQIIDVQQRFSKAIIKQG
ncbi:MAG: CsgG/HfaB family protein, partial [Candidatus Zixiibacteriota bacterium]